MATDQSTIQLLLDYVWVPIVLAIARVWSRVSGHDTKVALLEQADQHHKERLEAFETRMNDHNKKVYDKLDDIEKRIKNGH